MNIVDVVSDFFGMVILMTNNKESRPHIEVIYAGEVSKVSINSYKTLYSGKLNEHALGILQDWIEKNRHRLIENWNNLKSGKPIKKIEPIV